MCTCFRVLVVDIEAAKKSKAPAGVHLSSHGIQLLGKLRQRERTVQLSQVLHTQHHNIRCFIRVLLADPAHGRAQDIWKSSRKSESTVRHSSVALSLWLRGLAKHNLSDLGRSHCFRETR
ncbi:hypothetical protein CRV24_001882 [Beauveria bassiana]|nr:hypothetical protein CRV24_001882 [Beauveria bassiana]